jgi:hypothetical protein
MKIFDGVDTDVFKCSLDHLLRSNCSPMKKLWFRCQQICQQRVLKQRVDVRPEYTRLLFKKRVKCGCKLYVISEIHRRILPQDTRQPYRLAMSDSANLSGFEPLSSSRSEAETGEANPTKEPHRQRVDGYFGKNTVSHSDSPKSTKKADILAAG